MRLSKISSTQPMINLKTMLTEYINNNDAIKAKDTIKGEKKLMGSLLRCFDYVGLVNLEQLTFESYNDIIRYYRENTNNKNASINKFTTFLKTAIRYFGYHTHPFLLTKKLRSDVVHVRPYNQDDLLDIFKYMDRLEKSENSSVYRLVFHMLYATGCRITELLDIKIRNIDLKHRTILLEKTKARTSRYVFFTQHQTDLIKSEISKNHQQTWLFWNHIKNRR